MTPADHATDDPTTDDRPNRRFATDDRPTPPLATDGAGSSTVVLKLGGSLVTEKDRRETVDETALDAAAAAIADASVERLVVVHGGGSFGHPAAEERGVTTDRGTADAVAALAIHDAMKRLNAAVLASLHERGVPALPVHPLSAGARDASGCLDLPLTSVVAMLDEGFVPVLHGDGITHAGVGVTVVSGDELVVRLADGLSAERVGLCSTVPGVLDRAGEVIPRIHTFEDAADALGGSDATDVTGGMAAKVRTLLDLGAPAHVFGPDGLASFLAGGAPGTRIGTE